MIGDKLLQPDLLYAQLSFHHTKLSWQPLSACCHHMASWYICAKYNFRNCKQVYDGILNSYFRWNSEFVLLLPDCKVKLNSLYNSSMSLVRQQTNQVINHLARTSDFILIDHQAFLHISICRSNSEFVLLLQDCKVKLNLLYNSSMNLVRWQTNQVVHHLATTSRFYIDRS